MAKSSGIFWGGRKIEGIVFDVDGTLTDSIESYYEVFRQAMEQIGIPVKREEVLNPMATGQPIWDWAIPQGIANREEKIQQCKKLIPEIFRGVFSRVRPFPELDYVLQRLREREIHIGAVTSSWASAVRPLHDHSLVHYFKAIVTREDGLQLKPAPDSIIECLRRMEVDPEKALTVGDTPMDIRAGKAAGTLTIGVLSGIGNREQLEAETPTIIIDGVRQILSVLSLS
jgi:HAD superfamily hydrolase (TIGR01509 family)